MCGGGGGGGGESDRRIRRCCSGARRREERKQGVRLGQRHGYRSATGHRHVHDVTGIAAGYRAHRVVPHRLGEDVRAGVVKDGRTSGAVITVGHVVGAVTSLLWLLRRLFRLCHTLLRLLAGEGLGGGGSGSVSICGAVVVYRDGVTVVERDCGVAATAGLVCGVQVHDGARRRAVLAPLGGREA